MSVVGDLLSTAIVYILLFFALAFDVLWFPMVYYLNSPGKINSANKRSRTIKHVSPTNITWKSANRAGRIHTEIEDENIKTMAEMMMFYAHKYKDKKCLGIRKILDEIGEMQENGKTFTKYTLGQYEWKTYTQVDLSARCFGRGIREIGNLPHHNIAIFAETRAEWMIAAHGLFKQSIPIVTIYATLGEEGIIHAINETEVTVIITSHELVPKLKNALAMMPLVDTIVYMEDQLKPLNPKTLNCKGGHRLIKFSDIIKLGELSTIGVVLPYPEDTAIIMYTSGSTGTPKGVILRHDNLLSTLKAFADVTESMEFTQHESMIGFLPLAHIFELLVENVCLCSGIPIGYSNPNTLMDTSTKVRQGSKGDATILQPTIMTSVPLILDRVAKGVRDKVKKSGFIKKTLFQFGYKYKIFWATRDYPTPLIDKIIFANVAGLLGGRVRNILCGGAPLSVDTQRFIQTCLGAKIIIGYGLTETTSCATAMSAYDTSLGTVGQPTTSCYIRLIDWKSGGYSITDKPNPRGEILIGGPNISSGYYKLPEQTAEDFYTEQMNRSSPQINWFLTGDIGQVFQDGSLAIIDRRKDLVKLQNGEYVSLGKVETALKTCPLIDNACMVVWSNKEYAVALISPNRPNLEDIAKRMGIRVTRFEDLCGNPNITEAVLEVIVEHSKLCKFEKNETPARIKLCCQLWTPDSGLVTPTFKLRRKEIESYYKSEIEKLYQ